MFLSLKSTLQEVIRLGGRKNYQDIFGKAGQYQPIIFEEKPKCYKCENDITKEEYAGVAIFYCPHCQELHEDEDFNI